MCMRYWPLQTAELNSAWLTYQRLKLSKLHIQSEFLHQSDYKRQTINILLLRHIITDYSIMGNKTPLCGQNTKFIMLSTRSDWMLRFTVAGLSLSCSDSLLPDSPDAAPIHWIVSTRSRSVGTHFAPSCHRRQLLPQCPRPLYCSGSTTEIKSPNVGGCVSYSREDTDIDLTFWIPWS
jgi:hypothetical protein